MQIHQLKPKKLLKKKKRIGRGGKKGTYSGRGGKGQTARAGRKMQPIIRELIKKYPKLRGYRFKNFGKNIKTISLDVLEKNFQENELVSPAVLIEKKLIRRYKGNVPEIKILGSGKLTKKLAIEGCIFSKKALELAKKLKCEIK
ncbi:MAG: uL15 family ribosomal protein [bacterium]|nr:uL15 family ribosomal protein [bacterium]